MPYRNDSAGRTRESLKLNALEQEIGLKKAVALYKRRVSASSDEDNAFERLAVIYRSRNQVEDEVQVLEKAIAFYDHAVFTERLQSKLPVLNRLAKRLKTAKSLVASKRDTG